MEEDRPTRIPRPHHASVYINEIELEELKKELEKYKQLEKKRKENMEKGDKWKRSYHGICTTLNEAARRLKDYNWNLSKPEKIYELLTEIVQDFAGKSMHTAGRGMYRNKGIESIVEQLNNLQEDLTFQDKYKVTYKEKK